MGYYVLQLSVFISLNNKPVGRILCAVDCVMRNFRPNFLFGFLGLQINGFRSSCTFVSGDWSFTLPCLSTCKISFVKQPTPPARRYFRFMYLDILNCNHKFRMVITENSLSFLYSRQHSYQPKCWCWCCMESQLTRI